MADQDILHTAEIMKAALPFFNTGNKGMVEFFMKIFDLMASLKVFRTSANVAASGFEAGKLDLEGMLKGIRPVCNNKERESIDKILNFFNMKRAFEMYNKMSEMMNSMKDFDGFNFNDSGNEAETAAEDFGGAGYDNIFHAADEGTYSEDIIDSGAAEENDRPIDGTADSEKDKGAEAGTKSMMNDKMFEMLKAMVPPEQRSAFENLSMLLNTMSYDDNNSKPDDSEEKDNG